MSWVLEQVNHPRTGDSVSQFVQKLWPPGMYDFEVQKLRRNFDIYLINDLVKAALFGRQIL